MACEGADVVTNVGEPEAHKLPPICMPVFFPVCFFPVGFFPVCFYSLYQTLSAEPTKQQVQVNNRRDKQTAVQRAMLQVLPLTVFLKALPSLNCVYKSTPFP